MNTVSELSAKLSCGEFDSTLGLFYPRAELSQSRARYQNLFDRFKTQFGDRPVVLISAPGRTEVCGNHTDHQRGNILAAGVDLDIICLAAPNSDNMIRIYSEGFPPDEINLADLDSSADELGRSSSLIRGLAAWFSQQGIQPHGFDACTTSDVLSGSGLSSSAAFEVCVGAVMNLLWDANKSLVDIAIAGQYAENVYFGKPSGLMDQLVCAVGGFVQVDFANPAKPLITPIECDLRNHGYHLCIIDTKGNHADLTHEYAAIPAEMSKVSEYFGKEHLSEVSELDFHRSIVSLRIVAGDRAVLRAMHFFGETARVGLVAKALCDGDIEAFLAEITRSGRSSSARLQNILACSDPDNQGLGLALALSEDLLDGRGSWRVHGGGFAGTIQAFVPTDLLDEYSTVMNSVFGENACNIISIRPVGVAEILPEGIVKA